EGPYGTVVKVVYVSLFFGAGVLALYWFARSIDELRPQEPPEKPSSDEGEMFKEEPEKSPKKVESIRRRSSATG
ncbi:unnamed protein product, partial [Symbiodinium microadriaticum]